MVDTVHATLARLPDRIELDVYRLDRLPARPWASQPSRALSKRTHRKRVRVPCRRHGINGRTVDAAPRPFPASRLHVHQRAAHHVRLPPRRQLHLRLRVRVVEREVRRYDRRRQREQQHAGDCARAADDLAADRDRRDVAVADGRHGDEGPPERGGDAGEALVVLGVLCVVGERAERDDEDGADEEEEQELADAAADGLDEDLQHVGEAERLERAVQP